VVADALSRLDAEMSHSAYSSNALPEIFENSDGKRLTMDYPLSTAVIAETPAKRHKAGATHQTSSGVFQKAIGRA
jgi:hypothetical protein